MVPARSACSPRHRGQEGALRYARRVPIPDYIAELRRSCGQGLLFLPGVSAVLVDEDPAQRILLVRRADTGEWSLPSGIVEPDEQPAAALLRELHEETCVSARVDRLALLSTDPPVAYPNGDRCQFVAMTFRCTYLSGVAAVGDEESTEVAWFSTQRLPALDERAHYRISCALPATGETVFQT